MSELLEVRAGDADNQVGDRLRNSLRRMLPMFGGGQASGPADK